MTDEREKPLREMDFALLEMCAIFIDILVRMGVPKEEFEQQFRRSIERLKHSPQAQAIMEGMSKVAAGRADEFSALGKVRLLSDPPQGSA
jgi:hypothetical protein